MGRRKSTTKKMSTKKNDKLAKVFKCPFCSHDNSVECKMDLKSSTATLSCRRCDVEYNTQINYLSEPIDVYTEWTDAAEAENAANGDFDGEDGDGDDLGLET